MPTTGKPSQAEREDLEKKIANLKIELDNLSRRLNEEGAEAFDTAKKTAKEAIDSLKETFKDDLAELKKHGEDVGNKIKDNPLAATAIAAGVGLLVGILSSANRSRPK